MNLRELVSYLDSFLNIAQYVDRSNNGLQVMGRERVRRVALAVDACQAAFDQARAVDAHLLIVHHGLFWGQVLTLTGLHYRHIKTLLMSEVGLYAAHLPLDAHAEVGNNAEIFRLLGLQEKQPFAWEKGLAIGCGGTLPQAQSLSNLTRRLGDALGDEPRVLAFGPTQVQRVAICSGNASQFLAEAATAGYDTFVTGETNHIYYHHAHEYGLNVIYGGHYATERIGLQALARHLENHFPLETVFLDIPTGM